METNINRIDPAADVAASPKIESDKRAAKLRVLKILKDSSSFYASGAMSYLWGYIAPTKPLAAGQVRLNWTCVSLAWTSILCSVTVVGTTNSDIPALYLIINYGINADVS